MCLPLLCLAATGQARAQFVAYNDHIRGPLTAPNVSTYSMTGAEVGGPLTNFATGNLTSPNVVGVRIIPAGRIDGSSTITVAPNAGTPADQIFGGKIDWQNSSLYFGGSGQAAVSSVTFTFTNLTAGRVYRFRGTAIRGGGYATRWTLATLAGTASARPGHLTGPGSPGVVTNGWVPYGNTMMPGKQAAWNCGQNLAGDVIGWDEIVPTGASFSVICSNWTAATPGGSGNTTYCYAFNAIMLEEMPPIPPSILAQPQSQSVCPGAPATLTVSVSGTLPIGFQWRKEGEDLPAATNSSYSIAAAGLEQAGDYTVLVSNFIGSVTSAVATLTLATNPVVVVSQPQSEICFYGMPACLTIEIDPTTSRPVSYQWFKMMSNEVWLAIPNATGAALTISSFGEADVASYYVWASNCVNAVTSEVATLSLQYVPLLITNQPQDVAAVRGASASFTVGVDGSLPRYQWFKDGSAIVGATNAVLAFGSVQFTNSGRYHVEVSNPVSSVVSRDALLAVAAPPYQLIPLTNRWRFNQGGNDLGTSWRAPEYDDSFWPSGPGVLASNWHDAVVVALTRTTLSLTNLFGELNTTYYFRSQFVLTNEPSLVTICVSNLIDDGCVVYLNGAEAYRLSMPVGDIGHFTSASGPGSGSAFVTTSLPSSLLRQGTNTLAVEVHEWFSMLGYKVNFGLAGVVNFNPPSPIQITGQPQSAALEELRPAGFTVGFTGDAVQMQWYRQDAYGIHALPGSTSATLTLSAPIAGLDDGGYFVVLSNVLCQTTSAVATLTLTQAAPCIVAQPLSQDVCLGGPAAFQVTSYGSSSASWQWRFNGVDIPGGTNVSYLIPSVSVGDAGLYSVLISNAVGTANSSEAMLRVTPPSPTITVPPVAQALAAGAVARLSVTVEGCAPLMYQWQFNQVDIPGSTNPTLTVASLQASNTGLYRVIVSNAYGVAVSPEASLDFITLGQALNCTNLDWVTGTPPWRAEHGTTHDGVAALQTGLVGPDQTSWLATTSAGPCRLSFWCKVEPYSSFRAFYFRVDGTNALTLSTQTPWTQYTFCLSSNAHFLEWYIVAAGLEPQMAWLDEVVYVPGGEAPSIVTPPVSTTALAGSNVVFRVVVGGFGPFRYQWQLNDVDIPAATNDFLCLSNVQPSASGTYAVAVSNEYGTTPAAATLTVSDSPPVFLPQRPYVLATPGGDATIRARAIGNGPLQYQWRFEGIPIPGETNAVLLLRHVETSQAGHYSVEASNSLGTAVGPEIELVLSRVSYVIHISVDGLGAKYLDTALQVEPSRYPNFLRLASEGAFTFNARCDYFSSVTVPNHLSMLTGRPVLQPEGQPNTVHHGYTLDDTPASTTTIHNSGNLNVPYKASVFDVAHDHGLTTAFLASKSTLAIVPQSYDAANGAPDLIPPDNGQAKIDSVLMAYDSPTVLSAFLPSLASGTPYHYAFLHFLDLDAAGHFIGWGTTTWFDALQQVDAYLGRILTAIDTNSNPAASLQTAVILTADHGGQGYNHVDATLENDYTIPLFVWGPGIPGGTDLYSIFANRADPGTNQVDYNAVWQPLRNGDSGNLALALLGLAAIPGSTLIPLFPTSTPSLAILPGQPTPTVVWSAAAARFTLETSDRLGPSATWVPVANGILTNSLSLSYPVPQEPGARFFRLRE